MLSFRSQFSMSFPHSSSTKPTPKDNSIILIYPEQLYHRSTRIYFYFYFSDMRSCARKQLFYMVVPQTFNSTMGLENIR